MERKFFNPYGEIEQSKNRLPHWQQNGVTYFVTFRLADSLPKKLLDQWWSERAKWLKLHPPPWSEHDERKYHQEFTSRIESWLDEMHGSCHLRTSANRKAVESVIMRFNGRRYWHHAWVIMPNHAHVLVSLAAGEDLGKLLKALKGTSSKAVNSLIRGQGALWQKDYFDRMIRDAAHFWRVARYIRRNPEKASLTNQAFTLFESDHVRDVLDGRANG